MSRVRWRGVIGAIKLWVVRAIKNDRKEVVWWWVRAAGVGEGIKGAGNLFIQWRRGCTVSEPGAIFTEQLCIAGSFLIARDIYFQSQGPLKNRLSGLNVKPSRKHHRRRPVSHPTLRSGNFESNESHYPSSIPRSSSANERGPRPPRCFECQERRKSLIAPRKWLTFEAVDQIGRCDGHQCTTPIVGTVRARLSGFSVWVLVRTTSLQSSGFPGFSGQFLSALKWPILK